MTRIAQILMLIIFLSGCNNSKADKIEISGNKILLNGSPYLIRGVCYNPVPPGKLNERSFDLLSQDLALMKEAGINTIRVYSPIVEESVLDQVAAAGLRVIISIGYNQGGRNDILSGTYIEYINTFKEHPAILFWELGNEYNYHPEWFDGNIQNWYNALNEAARMIHKNDVSHPVATAHGELPDSLARNSCPDIDIWGMNVYRWDNPESIFTAWRQVSDKSMYLSEAGADSYMTITRDQYEAGENEPAQADAVRNILEDVFAFPEICSGLTLFAFVDEWWKAGNPETQDPGGWAPNSSGVPYDGTPNEEYWGIVDIQRNRKMAFDVVKDLYTGQGALAIPILSSGTMASQMEPPGNLAMTGSRGCRHRSLKNYVKSSTAHPMN